MTHALVALTAADAHTASALARDLARAWLRSRGRATLSRMIVTCALAVPAAVVWPPLWLCVAVAGGVFVVAARAERQLRTQLLPYTGGLVALFGAAAAARILAVAVHRGAGSEPVGVLLSGLSVTLRAARDADCTGGHLAGCRHRPVDGTVLRACTPALADLVGATTPVVG